MYFDFDLRPLLFLAAVGAISIVIGAIVGIIWLIHHISFV